MQQLIDNILADRENITNHLIYADYLEEQGDLRGEFIRCCNAYFKNYIVKNNRIVEILTKFIWIIKFEMRKLPCLSIDNGNIILLKFDDKHSTVIIKSYNHDLFIYDYLIRKIIDNAYQII